MHVAMSNEQQISLQKPESEDGYTNYSGLSMQQACGRQEIDTVFGREVS